MALVTRSEKHEYIPPNLNMPQGLGSWRASGSIFIALRPIEIGIGLVPEDYEQNIMNFDRGS